MPEYIEKAEIINIPVIALRGVVAFPGVTFSLDLSDEKNIAAAEAALKANSFVLLTAMRTPDSEICDRSLFRIGTAAKIKQSVRNNNGALRIIAEGFSRATLISVTDNEDYFLLSGGIQQIRENGFGRENVPAMMAAVVVISLPLIILFIIFRKKIMEGVARGGTKG